MRGEPSAPIGLIEYSDFECPFSTKFSQQTLPRLDREYITTGRLILVFKHLPLERIHSHARQAANVANCADRQGKFWTIHDQFFDHPKELGDAGIRKAAEVVGLDASVDT